MGPGADLLEIRHGYEYTMAAAPAVQAFGLGSGGITISVLRTQEVIRRYLQTSSSWKLRNEGHVPHTVHVQYYRGRTLLFSGTRRQPSTAPRLPVLIWMGLDRMCWSNDAHHCTSLSRDGDTLHHLRKRMEMVRKHGGSARQLVRLVSDKGEPDRLIQSLVGR